ncbi:MAG: SDR family oxidoreductase [Moraxella sp.]|nr:SDR family oxidoreductase [Moraxella sp.]
MNRVRYALITGANGGIGRALCSAFIAARYRVIALDLHDKPYQSLVFTRYIQADLAKFVVDEHYAQSIIDQIKIYLLSGRLHCLINNAAVQILGGVDTLIRSDWSDTLAVNLQAPFFLVQSFLSELEMAEGSVVNISSIHAKLTKKNFVAYATSKAALSGMTRAMAVDLGSRVRVNAIEPAAIETDMLKASFFDIPNVYEMLKNYHPVGRIGRPEEVAELALFLTDNKVGFFHGHCVGLNGGIDNLLFDPN